MALVGPLVMAFGALVGRMVGLGVGIFVGLDVVGCTVVGGSVHPEIYAHCQPKQISLKSPVFV